MGDAVALNLSNVHPKLKTIARNLPRVARSQGFEVRITSGFRSRASQTFLYNQWKRGLSHYPVALPGTSDHEKGLALDILSTNTNLLVADLQSVGLYWAGPADPIHFTLVARPPVRGPRLNEVAPVKAVPWEQMTKAEQMKTLLAALKNDPINKFLASITTPTF